VTLQDAEKDEATHLNDGSYGCCVLDDADATQGEDTEHDDAASYEANPETRRSFNNPM